MAENGACCCGGGRNDKKKNCLVCGKPLIYFEEEKLLECRLCHRRKSANAACEDGSGGAVRRRRLNALARVRERLSPGRPHHQLLRLGGTALRDGADRQRGDVKARRAPGMGCRQGRVQGLGALSRQSLMTMPPPRDL